MPFVKNSNNGLSKCIKDHRKLLSMPLDSEPYLSDIGKRFTTHKFLANCAQAVFRRQVEFLSRVLLEKNNKNTNEIKILDWGCGKGQISYLLKKQGFSVTSCDRNIASDDSAFGQVTPIIDDHKIDVIPLNDPIALPFGEGEIDCVVSFGVLEHVPHDLESLKEIHRVLKTGGLLYISFLPNALSWTQAFAHLGGDHYHDRLYWKKDVQALAAASQFQVESVWLGQLFPKNSVPFKFDALLEPIDRSLCRYTPLKYFATNLEAILVAL